jgi:hypothetical protein
MILTLYPTDRTYPAMQARPKGGKLELISAQMLSLSAWKIGGDINRQSSIAPFGALAAI